MSVYFVGFHRPPRCKTKSKRLLRMRLERLFDKFYSVADKIIQEHSPCKIKFNQRHDATVSLIIVIGDFVMLVVTVPVALTAEQKNWYSIRK
jgi:hypothetical protein